MKSEWEIKDKIIDYEYQIKVFRNTGVDRLEKKAMVLILAVDILKWVLRDDSEDIQASFRKRKRRDVW